VSTVQKGHSAVAKLTEEEEGVMVESKTKAGVGAPKLKDKVVAAVKGWHTAMG